MIATYGLTTSQDEVSGITQRNSEQTWDLECRFNDFDRDACPWE